MRYFVIPLLVAMLAGCDNKTATIEDLNSRDVTLPNGKVLRCEQRMTSKDVLRGMMFRESLAPDRGMLFLYAAPGHNNYWTYQNLIPLDIVWMDQDRRIIEIVADTPPCKTLASQCPRYGSDKMSQFVLEIGGGMARKYGLRVGDQIQF